MLKKLLAILMITLILSGCSYSNIKEGYVDVKDVYKDAKVIYKDAKYVVYEVAEEKKQLEKEDAGYK